MNNQGNQESPEEEEQDGEVKERDEQQRGTKRRKVCSNGVISCYGNVNMCICVSYNIVRNIKNQSLNFLVYKLIHYIFI